MDRQELQNFVAVCELGSLTAAARHLGVTPATVSKQLKSLETRLGVTLFHRTTRSLSLTEAGLRLREHARPLLDGFLEAERSVRESREEPVGCLRLSSPRLFGEIRVWPLLEKFLELHPKVTVELRTTDQIENLVASGIELAFRVSHVLADSGLRVQEVGKVRRTLVVSMRYLEERGEITLENLADHDAIRLAGRPSWFDQVPEPPRIRLEVDSDTVALEAAVAGFGITELPLEIGDLHLQEGRLVRVLPEIELTPRTIFAVRPPGFAPFRVQRLLDLAREAWAEDPDPDP